MPKGANIATSRTAKLFTVSDPESYCAFLLQILLLPLVLSGLASQCARGRGLLKNILVRYDTVYFSVCPLLAGYNRLICCDAMVGFVL